MRVLLLSLAVLLALGAAPTAQGHGLVNAGELEVLFVDDEASDVITGLEYGYDLDQLYIGEAHVPGIGDGIYLHTVLYGGVGDGRPTLDGPQTVAVQFEFGDIHAEHSFSTTDGVTFEGDFDQLIVVPGDGEVEVQRAFIRYPEGVGPGSKLTGFQAATFVNGEPRDVAPGGAFLPGTAPLDTPVPMGDSSQVVDSYELHGPGGYLDVSLDADFEAQTFTVVARNPLKEGDQHIMLVLPDDLEGWTATVEGDGGEVKAGGNATFVLRLAAGRGPLPIEVRTDIGGRVLLTAMPDTDDGGVVLSDGARNVGIGSRDRLDDALDVPLAGIVPLGALFAAALLARRVKG